MSRVTPLLCPLLVGRDDLLDHADRRLDDATDGRGHFLLLAGEVGVAKTRFLTAVGRKAATRGFDVAPGALAPQDRIVPGALILDLVRRHGSFDEPLRPLTGREYEVARLIAEGMTNAEIATELAIAPKTASAHVEHILAKLGVARRAEIATWVTTVSRPVAELAGAPRGA